MESTKIVFMGTPEIGANIFEQLLCSKIPILSVITRPDKPKGRTGKPVKSPVKIAAEKNQIPVFQPKNKEELTTIIKEIEPELAIVAAFGMIIPPEALEVPKFGMINFHPSLLPKYRGPAPIEAPILNGDKETGVSIIKVSEKMDAGPILAQEKISLTGNETKIELEEILAKIGTEMLSKIVPLYLNNEITPLEQNESKATYTNIINKEDGKVVFKNETASEIEKKNRAFYSWPGTYTYWNGRKIDLYNVQENFENLKPGNIIARDGKILIGTKKGSISVNELKIEGKNKVTAEDFLRGYPEFIEAVLQ